MIGKGGVGPTRLASWRNKYRVLIPAHVQVQSPPGCRFGAASTIQSILRFVSMVTVDQIIRHDDADPDDDVWVGIPPPVSPIDIVDADPFWPAHYDQLANRIRRALGDHVVALEHIGSTSVPGLAAKPTIDIDLTVTDSSDESAYVPPLEAAVVRVDDS